MSHTAQNKCIFVSKSSDCKDLCYIKPKNQSSCSIETTNVPNVSVLSNECISNESLTSNGCIAIGSSISNGCTAIGSSTSNGCISTYAGPSTSTYAGSSTVPSASILSNGYNSIGPSISHGYISIGSSTPSYNPISMQGMQGLQGPAGPRGPPGPPSELDFAIIKLIHDKLDNVISRLERLENQYIDNTPIRIAI